MHGSKRKSSNSVGGFFSFFPVSRLPEWQSVKLRAAELLASLRGMCGTARRRAALCPEGERARALFPGESTRGGRGNFFFGVETAQRGKQALERVKTPQLQSHTHFPSSLFHFFCVFMHDYTSSSFFEASGLKEFAGKSSSPSASHLASDKKLSCDASRHGIGQFTVESLGGTTRWAGRK